ncbi:hypothetical protein CgunFtcFv8_007896 [Champsocephalus gunnari]|uniref:Uncharacterized protein n=1 Tax=Champsocephalus gunnari TaxID=52237 RepID=A0AAN8HFC7_CHAGU|nr:hypothetical protein CgunFtcFv8_007896 [Champsocephalus gunnari]
MYRLLDNFGKECFGHYGHSLSLSLCPSHGSDVSSGGSLVLRSALPPSRCQSSSDQPGRIIRLAALKTTVSGLFGVKTWILFDNSSYCNNKLKNIGSAHSDCSSVLQQPLN